MAAKHFDSRKQALDHLRQHGFRPVPGRGVFEKCDEDDDEHIEAAWTPDAPSRSAGAGILFIDYVGPCDHGTSTQRNPIETERHALGVSRAVIKKSLGRLPIGSRILIGDRIFKKAAGLWEEGPWSRDRAAYVVSLVYLAETVQDAYDRNEKVKVTAPFGRIKTNPRTYEIKRWRKPDVYVRGLAIWYGPDGVEGDVATMVEDDTVSEYIAAADYIEEPEGDFLVTSTYIDYDELLDALEGAGIEEPDTDEELARYRVSLGVEKLQDLGGEEGWDDELPQ